MNEVLKATIDVLREHDIKPVVKPGGKHLKVNFELDGRPRTLVVSASPSDRNAALNARSVARRVLREPVDDEAPAIAVEVMEPTEAPRVRQSPHAPATKDYSRTGFVPIGPEPVREKPRRHKPEPPEDWQIYEERLTRILDRMIVKMRKAAAHGIYRKEYQTLSMILDGAICPYEGLRRSREWRNVFSSAADEEAWLRFDFIYEHGTRMQQAALGFAQKLYEDAPDPCTVEWIIRRIENDVDPKAMTRLQKSIDRWEKIKAQAQEKMEQREASNDPKLERLRGGKADDWCRFLFPVDDAES
jgi:hypothetical protein